MIKEAFEAGLKLRENTKDSTILINRLITVKDKYSLCDVYLTLCLELNVANNNNFMIDLLADKIDYRDIKNSLLLGITSYEEEEKISFVDAAKEWGVNRTTIQHAKQSGRLHEDEWEKIGRNLYVKVSAMNRLFGNRK